MTFEQEGLISRCLPEDSRVTGAWQAVESSELRSSKPAGPGKAVGRETQQYEHPQTPNPSTPWKGRASGHQRLHTLRSTTVPHEEGV